MVTPIFNASTVQTFYGTVTAAGDPKNEGHLLPASELNLLDPVDPEYAPTMAWLRCGFTAIRGGESTSGARTPSRARAPTGNARRRIPRALPR